jgi:hypothetical protein
MNLGNHLASRFYLLVEGGGHCYLVDIGKVSAGYLKKIITMGIRISEQLLMNNYK